MPYFFVFLFGLAVGSFLNVVICRLEKDKLILSGRSKCPKCKTILRWYDLIPLFSFIWQRGKCRYCGKKISWQYPLIEIFTGVIFLLIFNYQLSISNKLSIINFQILELFYYFVISSFLIIIFVYDLKHYLIPDKIVYPAIGIVLAYSLCQRDFIGPFYSALIASGFFLLLILISKGRWMGWGDVKLAFLMGLFLSWPMILAALFLSFFSGAAVGIWLIILGKKGMKSEIPFGPFLAGSTMMVFIFEPFFQSVLGNLFVF